MPKLAKFRRLISDHLREGESMNKHNHNLEVFTLIIMVGLFFALPAFAKDARLRVRVRPGEAYIFVDGFGKGDASLSGNGTLLLGGVSPGEHTVSIYNYGFVPVTRKVTVSEGQTAVLDITMEPVPGTVSGPWGRLQIEGGDHAAVLLNGKTPDYLVGQADEFNHDIIWKQELLVPPGEHELTLIWGPETVWSGKVNVPANQRVIVDVRQNGAQRTTAWPRGQKLGALPRFHAGIASAAVAVAPVSGQLSAAQTQIGCGESTRLTWSSNGAVGAEISGIGPVAASGEQTVSPKSTTTYNFTASGPGGVQKSSATVNVSSAIQASFDASPKEIRYRRQGDKVVAQDSATLSWSVANADTVGIDDFRGLAASGQRTVQPVPQATAIGPINETVNYTLTASNACGGTETRTIAVRLTGAIEPVAKNMAAETLETRLSINSIYFPTAIPRKGDKTSGLVPSQERRLTQMADDFKKYRELQPAARLIFQGHADVRGSKKSNQELSERRSASVKNFLVALGVPDSAIETRGLGAEFNLDEAAVRDLIEKNPNLTPESRKAALKKIKAFILANNRRVDVSLSTTGQQSARFFPYDSPDAPELLGEKPPRKR
jgi:outer membrane protein OmpA-like peptidoglycan-associated protein